LYPSAFEYQRVATLEEALEILARSGEETKILAGGQSLIPLMKLRLAAPKYLLDIGRITSLSGIRVENGSLRIGALTRHADLEHGSIVPELDILRQAARVIADPQVRNMGTIGGALAEVDPAGDWGAVLLALTSSVVCRSAKGERVLSLKDFFVDAYTSALGATEILTEVRIESPPRESAGVYVKLERKAGDFAVASAAVVLQRSEKDTIGNIGIGLAGVGLVPIKAAATENLLKGAELNKEIVAKAEATLKDEIHPLPDLRGSSEYKSEVATALFRQALTQAWERAGNAHMGK
jgi:carbon-monoxide dehydrogenase medium subunit